MKHKFSRILGVGLSLMLLISLLAFATPVSAGTLSWSTVTIPSTDGKVLAPGTDIVDLAVARDGETIYAATKHPLWDATGNFTVNADDPATSVVSQWTTAPDSPGALTGTIIGEFTGTATDDLPLGDFSATAYVTFNVAIEATLEVSGTITDTSLTFSGTIEVTKTVDPWVLDDETVKIVAGAAGENILTFVAGAFSGTLKGKSELDGNLVDLVLTPESTMTMTKAPALCKSTNAGETWSSVTVDAEFVQLVAVAPDDEDIAAIVADDKEVYVTTDGGTNWSPLGLLDLDPTVSSVNDIAISAESGGKHYIAVAGVEEAVAANLWYYDLGASVPKWTAMADLGAEARGFTTGDVAAAVAFSPNFASDKVMVAVTANLTPDVYYVYFQIFSFSSKEWNKEAGFTDYPVKIVTDAEASSLVSASISLDPEYLGSDDAMRLAFVGLTLLGDAVAKSGIYRLDDTSKKVLKEEVDIHSVAYDGTNLVAGRSDSATVYRCDDPLATSPSVKSSSSLKSPGGKKMVVVAWAGDDVVAGTTGSESAFAVSRDDGKTFSDISLIDTALIKVTDVAVSADGSKVYMATDDGFDFSLWRQAASWERVLTVQGKAGFIVRLAPDDADVVYLAKKDTTSMYYSTDGGKTRWQLRSCLVEVQDLAVETGGDVVYALNADGKVSKSINSGFTWGTEKSTKLNDGNMIVSLGEDKLLVGSQDGYVAYSADGNDSWTKIDKKTTTGAVQVIASGLRGGDFIYAATAVADEDIYRWEIGTSTSWKSIKTEVAPVYGIALQDGILYAQAADTYRTLNPTADAPSWSTMAGKDFMIEPQALKVSAGKLWAIDTSGENELYSYSDTLATTAPGLVSPKHGATVKVNPVTGYATDVAFSWKKPSDKVTGYHLRIACDEGFDEELDTIKVDSTSSKVSQVVGHGVGENGKLDFMPGETYYWKVRVAPFDESSGTKYGPIYSPWSIVYSFTVEEAVAPVTTVTVEPAPAPEITVTAPPAPEVTVNIPPAPTPVAPPPAIPAYLLWTIICIGAVLIIALIVLIVRTRRVV